MLQVVGQDDFAAGMVRSRARHLIPPNGCYDLVNYLLDDDGSLYRRGGSRYVSDAAFGDGLTFLWDGTLVAGARTVVANSADFGVLAADGRSIVNLGGAGLAAPTGYAVLGGVLFIGGGVMYAGSRMAADYSTGTVTATLGSTQVTGSSTVWGRNADAGMFLSVAGGQVYAVRSVDSDTRLTLDRPFLEATASARAYTLTRLATPAVSAPIYAAGGDRLIAVSGTRVMFSLRRDDTTGALRYGTFDSTDYLLLPDGADALGAQVLRDQLLVFSTQGVWAVTNLAMDLTDDAGNVQRGMERVTGDIVLWDQAGFSTWQNALLFPTLDGVVLMDGISGPQRVARSITPVVEDYVRAGYRPGGAAVFGSHYFLPILNQGGEVVDQLVCRLDRPVETAMGVIFPWARWSGHGADVAAWSQRVGGASAAREPALLAAGLDGRLLDLTGAFRPDEAGASDADGTAHETLLETRDFATGPGNLNHVLRLRVRYELVGAALLTARYSIGAAQEGIPYWGEVDWGEFDWSDPALEEYVLLNEQAGESTGRDPMRWRLGESATGRAGRGRIIRARLESTEPASRLVIRSLEWGVRQSAKDW